MRKLPQEIIHPLQRKTLVRLITYTVSLFLLFNVVLYIFLRKNPYNFSAAIIIEKWNLIEKIKGKEVSCLLIGDSAGNQGLDTDLFPNSESVYNLCTIGNFILYDDVLMLKYLIENGTIPKKIVIVHVYDVWERSMNYEPFQHIPIKYFNEKENLDFVKISNQQYVKLFRNRFFPIYSQNQTLKSLFLEPKSIFLSHNFAKNGFMPQEEARKKSVLHDAEGHALGLKDKQFELSKDNRKLFEYLIALIEKHKIPTYLVESPIVKELFDDSEYKRYNGQIQDELRNIADKSEYLHFISFDERVFPADQMQNADHVTKKAAAKYTKMVVSKIE